VQNNNNNNNKKARKKKLSKKIIKKTGNSNYKINNYSHAIILVIMSIGVGVVVAAAGYLLL